MIIEGESLIPTGRKQVWKALNDPEVLRRSIPGCQSLEETGENSFNTTVRASVGPISATFNATVTITDIQPERGYTIVGEGKGGAAGFARGQAKVELGDAESGTRLQYTADVNVGGKLAQVGSRLIQGTAKKLSEQFFGSFAKSLNADAGVETAATRQGLTDAVAAQAMPARRPAIDARVLWVGAIAVLLVLAGWWALSWHD